MEDAPYDDRFGSFVARTLADVQLNLLSDELAPQGSDVCVFHKLKINSLNVRTGACEVGVEEKQESA